MRIIIIDLLLHDLLQGGAPPVISWFINPIN